MLKLLRADLYKVFRPKSFWILSILTALMLVLDIFEQAKINAKYAAGIATNDWSVLSIYPRFVCDYISNAGFDFSFVWIFTPLFVCSDYSFGTVKTLVARGGDRLYIYLSKLAASITAGFFSLFLYLLILFTYGGLSLGFGTFTADHLNTLLTNVLQGIGSVCFCVMASFILRSTTFAIGFNILATLFSSLRTLQVLDATIEIWFNLSSEIQLETLWIQTVNTATDGYLTVIIVSVCYIIIPTVLGIWCFKSRDIK